MNKSFKVTMAASALLAFSPVSNATLFDFAAFADANTGTKLFESFVMTEGGLTLTATATADVKNSSGNRRDAKVYLDKSNSVGEAGMGVCSEPQSSGNCGSDTDSGLNPTDDDQIDSAWGDQLIWSFDTDIASVQVHLVNAGHGTFSNKDFEYSLNGTSWMPATTDGAGHAMLGMGGGNDVLFRSAAASTGFTTTVDSYYISHAAVSAVPVPAAIWLFGSGLIGLVGIARRRKG